MEEGNIPITNEPTKRPVFLTVLCVLTFIASGLGCLSALITPVFSETVINFLKSTPNFDEVTANDAIVMLQAGWGFYLPTFLLTLGALVGAILMWQLKKMGFHFYALSNLALLFLPMLLLHMEIGWSSIVSTASFIALYALNLKYMK